ncbi:S10 family peptidase [Gallaecimonas mangrovi]|uniref:S10 family peptidase n=1 Tax=Gallaecimonas mangrovi TaxID=2291597 RepID=UPI000E206679|nr:peptidase S10 [Gallaecimonas mangrovi]
MTTIASKPVKKLAIAALLSALMPALSHAAEPAAAITQHKVKINGHEVAYQAQVTHTQLLTMQGKPGADVVSVSYLRSDIKDESKRPVLFVFNGGPGAASLWTHLGFVGPRRLKMDQGNNSQETTPRVAPPYQLEDNGDSPLDVADIVLFDPPGTGYSTVLPGVNPQAFYGVEADAAATTQFIENWLKSHHRLNSPRFIMGESYGTIRAAEVAKRLAGGPFGTHQMDGVALNGVILLGQAMDMRNADRDKDSVNLLPTLAALDWYYHPDARHGLSLEQKVEQARQFAAGPYLKALYKGATLGNNAKQQLAQQLADLTGLSAAQVLADDLRFNAHRYAQTLLASKGLDLGMYDGRFTLPAAANGGDPVADDPAMAQYVPAFVASIQRYLRKELHADLPGTYHAIDFTVNGRWDYGHGPGVPASKDYAPALATAMRRNPQLQLFLGMGYYDLVTPMGNAEYVADHDGFDLKRVHRYYYQAGHMPYLGKANREKLAKDIRQFLTQY